jgi:hypothetical protein
MTLFFGVRINMATVSHMRQRFFVHLAAIRLVLRLSLSRISRSKRLGLWMTMVHHLRDVMAKRFLGFALE